MPGDARQRRGERDGIPLRVGIPIVLWALPLAVLPLVWTGPIGGLVFWGSVGAHAIGADWLSVVQKPRSLSARQLAAVHLAIGAPTGLWAIVLTTLIARQGDVAWMALPIAVGPALCVWPFVLASLTRGPSDHSA
jgi:hypothetical protein